VADSVPGETRWLAPAKLNLFLHVTGRRPDGYHELQTLFQLIDLCDTIAIRVPSHRAMRALIECAPSDGTRPYGGESHDHDVKL